MSTQASSKKLLADEWSDAASALLNSYRTGLLRLGFPLRPLSSVAKSYRRLGRSPAKLEMGRATLFVLDTNALREMLQHVLALLQQKVQKTTRHQRQFFAFQVYGIPTAY